LTRKPFRLFEEIINRSEADTWEEAKGEWQLDHTSYASDEEVAHGKYTCLCGHTHLRELCFISNERNGNQTMVGNCCIKKFMEDIQSDKIFQAVKRKRINSFTLDHAKKLHIIKEWEYNFAKHLIRKRKIPPIKAPIFQAIQSKILRSMGPKKKVTIDSDEAKMIAQMDQAAMQEPEHV
jgi:hypothetical protein